MSILGAILGSKKVIDGGMNAIDAMHVSGEERADIKQSFLSLYEPFKRAQRWLMMIVSIPFVSLHVITFGFWLYSLKTMTDIKEYKFLVSQIQEMVSLNNAALGEPLGWIVMFYYAGGAAEGAIKRFINKRA